MALSLGELTDISFGFYFHGNERPTLLNNSE